MKLFRRDPEKGREAARSALAAVEAQIVELRRERAAKLVETDGIEDVQAIDRKIEEQRRAAQIHRDRIVLLDGECRAQAAERRERKREASLKVIEKKLADREALALKLEESIKRTGDLYFELTGSASIAQDWPFREPSPRFGFIDIDGVKRELGWALFSAGRPIGGRSLLPAATNAGIGVTGISPAGIAGLVAERSRSLLLQLREMPLDEDADEQADESAPNRGLAALATS